MSAEIWDGVHYIQLPRVNAHEADLIAAEFKGPDRMEALSRIWYTLSDAARRVGLDPDLVQQELAELQLSLKSQGAQAKTSGDR